MLMSDVVALAGHVAGQVAVAAVVSAAEMLLVVPVVQVSVVVMGDTRLSLAASDGCPLGMMLGTVVVAADMQVAVQEVVQMAIQVVVQVAVQMVVQVAVQVAVVAAVLTTVQVAGLS
ncbi:hypothetical protein NDU88_005377 [Pleurodeles waltl]|uniref:Uncharacterized protein n=1 Tax=Pleurodeles waltl TaxID=8319 RepID=A0AAV7V7S7_PLEWA|nr:hypothetical protein NDU88_005377 [Pleurodeles waltl]